MKPLSSSQRLRRILFLVVPVCFVVALIGYFGWQHYYSPEKRYRAMVSAFYSGVIALQVGDDGHALSALTQATQIDAQEPAAWADLGLYYLRHSNPDEARKALEKAQGLAPKNARIASLLGLLAAQSQHYDEAVTAYQKVIALDPTDLQARYALAQALEQQAGPGADTESRKQLQIIYEAMPDNLYAELELVIPAAKAGDAGTVRRIVARLATHSASWTPEMKGYLKQAQKAVAGPDPRGAALFLQFLQNLLKEPEASQYKEDAAVIIGRFGVSGIPLDRFVTLPSPSPTPAAPDAALKFTAQPLPAPSAGPWAWARTVLLSGDGTPTLLVADGKELRVGSAALPFPGGPKAVPPTPDGVVAFDSRNTGQMDLACAGAGGLRLYQQGAGGTFTDVTGASKLPPDIIGGAYTGVWASAIVTGGQLDLVLGTTSGPPTVLRNNGDGTWAVLHPFGAAKSGLRQWAWADLDGDGLADTAFLDSRGRLVVLENKRAGAFAPWPLPADVGRVAALSVADPTRVGTMDVVFLTADGGIRRLSRKNDGTGWDEAELGRAPAVPADGSARLQWADLDNNGALDLIVTSSRGSQVLLGDAQGRLTALAAPADARSVSLDAQAIQGRLDLIGLNAQGQPVRLVNSGSKDYGWQEVRLRAAEQHDKRNNTYGIGSEIGLRAGLLYETRSVSGPVTHFGLGENERADSIRMVWPNGNTQGEFELKADQLVQVPERLKGSCPWLLADDGTGADADAGMKFVTDFIWRSPLGLRINAQDTAGVVQTRDWVKVRGDQLRARDGYYNLRITADLWETHFFDEVKLMTVDHPIGTEVNVDERFSIPPPPLAVNAMTPPQPVVRATDEHGRDVSDLVRARDGKYLDTFRLGEYQGVAQDHWVTLDLGPNLPTDKTWLVGVGWIHPTDSSINVALGEGHHVLPRDLSLEIPDGRGGWKTAKPHLGFPEGKNKTVLIPIAGLFKPGVPHQVRLRTNLEIYWDFLGTAQALPPTILKEQTLAPSSAVLRYRGFSATHQASHSSPEIPDYAHLAQTGPQWLDLEGYYTRYGDVRALLASTDDRYVIMNAGDEMVLRFPAPPPPPPGWTRDYVLIGDGWVKDGDFNTGFSRTVLPLPSHSRPAYNTPPGRLVDDPVYKAHRQDWATYQTRWVSQRQFHEALRP